MLTHCKKFKFQRIVLWPWTQESEDLEREANASELYHIAHALTFLVGMLVQGLPPKGFLG